ncbi:MAG: HAMP domain-containing histidine kinase, partial [Nitrospirae bacterium]|nr:HAMP domain-containing histidine kinase [Nitrospirota bacterium]
GPGISAEEQARLFEPFFTTKEKGIGLGMTICRKIMEKHGGRISVHSEPGTGTTVTLAFLPGGDPA